ncbi:hypothetical protein K353_00166 [Kitasatospora sp. SolWspMP-SS2h]|uniref:hypothetical protein n=1 Tax=Kitasatospora sp. SolWspMP-SS2h TaxID=1305729 RepID=UPI000DBA61D7|nr:hypothetical protein [Kitasatospora sp. SolWspMP-SS2h]RAJ46965.1 hypothetical protein K353_00166 [Kitasatospora sp. SolWspMP-SS2h]
MTPPPPPPAAGPDRPTPGARRRSGFVALGMVGTLALTLSGCSSSSKTPSRCVDPGTLKVLDAHSCSAGGSGAGQWYYCGSGTTTASGGTFSKSAAKRGGFGCPKGSSSGSGGG